MSSKQYRLDNAEKLAEWDRGYRERNRVRLCLKSQKYYKENRKAIAEKGRIYRLTRWSNDPSFKLTVILRNQLRRALGYIRAKKSASTLTLLGCPVVWLRIYLASLFRPGMTWENHGSIWHIDHIKPISSFTLSDPIQQRACFHWTNLQPLFALENLQKSDTYAPSEQPPKEIGSRCCQALARG